VYFLWALGYESVWVVLIPVQLAELLFPEYRDEPWLKTRGLVIASCVFLSASFVAWYAWTQLYVPQAFPGSVYRVPPAAIVSAAAVVVALVWTALTRMPKRSANTVCDRPVPPLPFVVLFAFALAGLWFCLVFLAYGAAPALPVFIPIVTALSVAAATICLVTRWSSSRNWRESHRLALCAGALAASMAAGFPIVIGSRAPIIDLVGKAAFNLLAVVLLIQLARKVAARDRISGEAAPASTLE
jgi:hypothetical protein